MSFGERTRSRTSAPLHRYVGCGASTLTSNDFPVAFAAVGATCSTGPVPACQACERCCEKAYATSNYIYDVIACKESFCNHIPVYLVDGTACTETCSSFSTGI
mmetsp:Transcript_25055/g.82098  ORF Transcript_25055/g.82098 Transcript_25055/m.82098 type:complete len:103 (+) Transcript_25055:364-672(+)